MVAGRRMFHGATIYRMQLVMFRLAIVDVLARYIGKKKVQKFDWHTTRFQQASIGDNIDSWTQHTAYHPFLSPLVYRISPRLLSSEKQLKRELKDDS